MSCLWGGFASSSRGALPYLYGAASTIYTASGGGADSAYSNSGTTAGRERPVPWPGSSTTYRRAHRASRAYARRPSTGVHARSLDYAHSRGNSANSRATNPARELRRAILLITPDTHDAQLRAAGLRAAHARGGIRSRRDDASSPLQRAGDGQSGPRHHWPLPVHAGNPAAP